MSKKILFMFAGTGETASQIKADYEKDSFNDDVIRVYFNGCHDSSIGGRTPGLGYIYPELETAPLKIKQCFDKNGHLSLEKLKKEFGSAIIIEGINAKTDNMTEIPVENITLSGFSRGAVSCFATARHLNDLNIQMSLFAKDPVPGETRQTTEEKNSQFHKNHDLRDCTNLKKVVITLGVFKKPTGLFQNRYKQMVPLFNDSCDTAIYAIPKKDHLQWSPRTINHQNVFFYENKLRSKANFEVEFSASMHYAPKILQQKFHRGVTNRVEFSTRYKDDLYELIKLNHPITQNHSLKVGQALRALDEADAFDGKENLLEEIKSAQTIQAKARREFIVEFQRINAYAFDDEIESFDNVLKPYTGEIYQLLANFNVEKSTLTEKHAFSKNIFLCLEALKGKIPRNCYSTMHKLMKEFLKENVTFHPDLTEYIDETETLQSKPAAAKYVDNAFLYIQDIQDASELAERLYHMSEKARSNAYDKFAANLPQIVHNATELGDIIRFLPSDKISKALKIPQVKKQVASIDDINAIMSKLFSNDHRKAFFSAVKDRIQFMPLNFDQLEKLMQYLSAEEGKYILKAIPTSQIHSSSATNIVKLFNLEKNELEKLLPEFAILLMNLQSDKSFIIRNNLSKKLDDKDIKLIDKFFPDEASSDQDNQSITSSDDSMLDITIGI